MSRSLKQRSHLERSREKIINSGMLDRLIAFVMGWCDPNHPDLDPNKPGFSKTGEKLPRVEMTSTQVNAALSLIRKTMPDLKVVENYIEDRRPKTREDVDGMFAQMGFTESEREKIWSRAAQNTMH